MVTGKLRRSGNSFIVTVPRDEVELLGLKEGEMVSVNVHAVEVRPVPAADLRDALEIVVQRGQGALRNLAEQ